MQRLTLTLISEMIANLAIIEVFAPEPNFLLIHSVIEKYDLKNMVSFLCEASGVSRSGYYIYFSLKSQEKRNQQENEDLILNENILKAFHFKRRKKGARQIMMTLEGQFQNTYNLK
jgi:hypothetical protein